MDPDISGWILEFLLHQNALDDRSLNDLIRAVPLPHNNPRLKKRLIIRKIESDVGKGRVSELTITFLAQIEQLDIEEGNVEVSDAMKIVYITIAMHFIVKYIEENDVRKKRKYTRVAKRFWNARIREMEMSDVCKRAGLAQEDLMRLMDNIDAWILNADVCETVVAKFKAFDVLEALGHYVNETKEKMGSSFLELAFGTISSDRDLSKIMGLDEAAKSNKQIRDGASTVVPGASEEVDAIANDNSKGNDASRAHLLLPGQKYVPPRVSRGPAYRSYRGARVVDPLETLPNMRDSISTPVVEKIQKDLESSSFELRALVKDPLPDALRFAGSLKASMVGDSRVHDCFVGNSSRVNVEAPGSSHERNNKGVEAYGDDDQNKRPRSSFMDRSTAHTTEIDGGSPTRPRPHLPTPSNKAASPLSIYKMEKLLRQRKRKRWSVLEEDALRAGVEKYGRGNWKLILNMQRDIFVDRNEVDLKDKWRNLTR